MRLALSVAFALFAPASALPQDTPAGTPPPVVLRAQVLGPAGWRARLGPTNLGTMLATEGAERIWRRYADAVDGALCFAQGDAAAFARARATVLDYAGAVGIVVWLEQPEDALHTARWSAALVADHDGHTDLGALAAEAAAWLARVLEDRTRGRWWRDLGLLPPHLHEGRLVAVLAHPEDKEAALARAYALRLPALPRASVLQIETSVPAALGLVRDRPQQRGWWRALFGAATKGIAFDLGHAGPQLAIETRVDFGDGDRGFLGGLLGSAKGKPFSWLPDGTAAWFAGPVDVVALWHAATAMMAEQRDVDRGTIQAEWRQRLGIDVAKDLAPHLGDAAILLWQQNAPQQNDHSLLGNACLVVPVRDEAAAAAGFKALLGSLGLRMHVDKRGVLVAEERGFLWLPTLCFAAGNGVACLAVGNDSKRHVEAVLDRAAEGPPTGNAASSADGHGRVDAAVLLGRHLPGILGLLGTTTSLRLPRPTAVAAEAEAWLPLLARHGMSVATRTCSATATTWSQRVLW